MLKKVIMKSHTENKKLLVPKHKMNRTHSTETLTDKSEMKESSTRKGKAFGKCGEIGILGFRTLPCLLQTFER